MDVMTTSHVDLGNITLLVLASYNKGQSSASLLLRFMPAAANPVTGSQSGRFVLHQHLKTEGAWAVRFLPGAYGGAGPLLAVANRQNMSYADAATSGANPWSIYDVPESQVRELAHGESGRISISMSNTV